MRKCIAVIAIYSCANIAVKRPVNIIQRDEPVK